MRTLSFSLIVVGVIVFFYVGGLVGTHYLETSPLHPNAETGHVVQFKPRGSEPVFVTQVDRLAYTAVHAGGLVMFVLGFVLFKRQYPVGVDRA